MNEEALAQWGLLRHTQKKKIGYISWGHQRKYLKYLGVKMLPNTELNYSLFGDIHVNTLTFYDFIYLFNYIFSRQLSLNCKLT